MVEGPGATRNGRKVQVAVGKTMVAAPTITDHNISIIDVDSSTPGATLSPPTLPHNLATRLAGQILEEAFTVGKELFLIFKTPKDNPTDPNDEATALRLHFGMNGSLVARKVKSKDLDKKPSGVAPWKKNLTPSLRLYFTEENQSQYSGGATSNYIVVESWETTVQYPVSAVNSRVKLMELSSRDVCSTFFNAQDVFSEIRTSGNNLIVSDALLNQDIFPGVGNIIKIESLHLSKIDPRRIVSSLTDAELRRLVKHSRKFSMDWLKTGRAGTKLVYNQTSCGTCKRMTVKMQKIGGSTSSDGANETRNAKGHAFMSRVTFWCTVCQPLAGTGVKDEKPKLSLNSQSNLFGVFADRNNAINASATTNRPQAQCPQHGRKTIKLCRVRKGNQNVLRIFFTCKKQGCQFFHWADAKFSNCRCGKKAILRVSKTEKSGGRWFLCCASGDKSVGNNSNGCGYFEWANDDQLQPIRSHLTPLL